MRQHNPKHLISVKESIMRLLMRNSKKWFGSRLITDHLKDELNRDVKPTSCLLQLTIRGHVIRAYKPKHLINSKNGKQEFIYKWSGKPYRDEIERIKRLCYADMTPTDKAKLMRCLGAHYPDLPSWYQRMML